MLSITDTFKFTSNDYESLHKGIRFQGTINLIIRKILAIVVLNKSPLLCVQ